MGDEYGDIVNQLREGKITGPEAAERLAKFSGSALTKRAAAADAARARIEELENERRNLLAKQRVGEIRGTLRDAGVKVDEIRALEWQAIAEKIPEDEVDESWVAGIVSEFELPMRPAGR